MKKFLLTLIALLLTLGAQPALANSPLNLPADAGMAVDLTTGKILYEKNADEKIPVANLSRLITIYMTYQAVEDGKLNWTDQVPISDKAYELTSAPGVGTVLFEKNSYSVQELLKASIISASGPASLALAEHLAGDEHQFVDQMRALLDSWGIDSHFIINASGANNAYLGEAIYPGSGREEENRLSARDLAIISNRLLTDYPEVLDISQATLGDFAGSPLHTYNYLLENMPYARRDSYGLVTGSSDYSGSSLISVSMENHMQVLTIIIGAQGGKEDSDRRFVIANQFLDDLGDAFHLQKVLNAYDDFEGKKAPVLDGKASEVDAVVQDDFFVVTTPATTDKVKLKAVFPPKTNFAPIEDEQVVGQVVFEDQVLVGQGYLEEPPHMNLIANGTVARSNIFKVMWNAFVRYVLEYL